MVSAPRGMGWLLAGLLAARGPALQLLPAAGGPCGEERVPYESTGPQHSEACLLYCVPWTCVDVAQTAMMRQLQITAQGNCWHAGFTEPAELADVDKAVAEQFGLLGGSCSGMQLFRFGKTLLLSAAQPSIQAREDDATRPKGRPKGKPNPFVLNPWTTPKPDKVPIFIPSWAAGGKKPPATPPETPAPEEEAPKSDEPAIFPPAWMVPPGTPSATPPKTPAAEVPQQPLNGLPASGKAPGAGAGDGQVPPVPQQPSDGVPASGKPPGDGAGDGQARWPVGSCDDGYVSYISRSRLGPNSCGAVCVPEGMCEFMIATKNQMLLNMLLITDEGDCQKRGFTQSVVNPGDGAMMLRISSFGPPACHGLKYTTFQKPEDENATSDQAAAEPVVWSAGTSRAPALRTMRAAPRWPRTPAKQVRPAAPKAPRTPAPKADDRALDGWRRVSWA